MNIIVQQIMMMQNTSDGCKIIHHYQCANCDYEYNEYYIDSTQKYYECSKCGTQIYVEVVSTGGCYNTITKIYTVKLGEQIINTFEHSRVSVLHSYTDIKDEYDEGCYHYRIYECSVCGEEIIDKSENHDYVLTETRVDIFGTKYGDIHCDGCGSYYHVECGDMLAEPDEDKCYLYLYILDENGQHTDDSVIYYVRAHQFNFEDICEVCGYHKNH